MTPFGNAESMISNLEQDERFKQAAVAIKGAAALTQEAIKSVSQKISQEDSWEHAFGAVEQLSEIARAHQSLLVDLIDRVEALETPAGSEVRSRDGDR
jgi:hypothetical protein